MAANVTLTVNTQPAMQGLYKVNDVINQVKINGQNITIGSTNTQSTVQNIQKVTQGVKDLGGAAEQTGGKAKGAMMSLTAQGKRLGMGLKTLTTGMVSWWTAVIIAVELAAKTFTYFFNNLTESIPKIIAKSQNLVSITEKQASKLEKQKKQSDDLRKSLQSLAQKQTLTSSQQIFAQAVIDKLTKRYKGLKLSIDETTGAIVGYDKALDLMNEKDRQRELKLVQRQIDAQRQATNAQLANTFGGSKVSLDKGVSGRDFFTFAENSFGDLSSMDRDRIARRWNQGDLYAKKKVLEDLATLYSNNEEVQTKINGAIDSLDKLIQLQQKYNDLTDASSLIIQNHNQQLEKTKGITGEIVSLQEKAKQAMQALAKSQRDEQFNALENNQQKAEYLQKELDELNKQFDQTQADIESANDELLNNTIAKEASDIQTDEFNKDISDKKKQISELKKSIQQIGLELKRQTGRELTVSSYGVDYRKSLQSRLDFLNNKIRGGEEYQGGKYRANDKVYAERDAIVAELDAINKVLAIQRDIKKTQDERDKLIEQLNAHLAEGNQSEEKRLQSQKKVNQLRADQAQKQLEIQQKRLQLEAAQKAIKEQQAKQEAAIQNLYGDYEAQLQAYNKSTRQLAIETALANAEKIKGAELTQEQIDQIQFYINQIENLKELEEERAKKKKQQDAIDSTFQGYEQDQSVAYLKLIGLEKQSLLLQARINAEKAKGAALTEDELDSLKNYIDVQQLIQDATNAPNVSLQTTGVITNQLAKKGGFASSVVTDRAQDINKQILNQQRKQTDITTKIKDAIDKYSVIQ